MTNEYTSQTTWADVAREEEEFWNRPKCRICGDDYGLTHKIIYPFGEEEWYCEDCWRECNDEN